MALKTQPLVQVMNGPFITDDQNFLKSILPYLKRAKNNYNESMHLVMNVVTISDENCDSCEKEPNVPSASQSVSALAASVDASLTSHWPHVTEGHKCYPIGSTIKPSIPPYDKEDSDIDKFKSGVSLFQARTINDLREDGNRLIFLKLFSTMANEGYVEYCNVMPLTALFVDIANYASAFAGSISMVEMVYTTNLNTKKPISIIKVCSYYDIKKRNPDIWKRWYSALLPTNISLEMSVLAPNEQIPLQLMDDVSVNWCFSINHDSVSGVDTFVLTDCRPIVTKNTYGLTILNKDFTLNVVSNLEMRVPIGTTFRFVASIDSAVIDSFAIKVKEPTGWKSYVTSPRDVRTLDSLGIVIEDTKFSINKTEYIISITRDRDIQISLNPMVLTYDPMFIPAWDETTVNFTIVDEEVPCFATPRPALRAYAANRKHTFTAAFSLDFGFLHLEGTNVRAYAVPITKYADRVDEDSIEVNISQYVPVRMNTGERILMTVNNIPVDVISDRTFLLRVVFGNGSLSTITETKDARSVKVGNYETAFQFEVKFANDVSLANCEHKVLVVSSYGGYTFGTTGTIAWNPPIPMPLYTNGISMVSSEYYSLATIDPTNGRGTLTLKPNINLSDVPLGIPAGAGATSLVINGNPIDENYYFAFIKLPYTAVKSSLHISMPALTMKGVHQITVKSTVRQLFDLTSEQCYYDELNGTAVYNHPTLTCDDKHVILPIFFSNKDNVVIAVEDTYCSGKIEFVIDVDLGELPPVEEDKPNEGEPPVNPPKEEGGDETEAPSNPPEESGEDKKEEDSDTSMEEP